METVDTYSGRSDHGKEITGDVSSMQCKGFLLHVGRSPGHISGKW